MNPEAVAEARERICGALAELREALAALREAMR
jgi:hypothetical protein